MAVKTTLLEIEAILSNAVAELSLPTQNVEKAKRAVEVARDMLLKLAEEEGGRDPLSEAKRKLALIYLGMPEAKFTSSDSEMFSLLSKERELQAELERARKNN